MRVLRLTQSHYKYERALPLTNTIHPNHNRYHIMDDIDLCASATIAKGNGELYIPYNNNDGYYAAAWRCNARAMFYSKRSRSLLQAMMRRATDDAVVGTNPYTRATVSAAGTNYIIDITSYCV